MSTDRPRRRLPRSLRKHLRFQKALLRRTLSAAEADRAIAQLERSLRRGGGTTAPAAPTVAPGHD